MDTLSVWSPWVIKSSDWLLGNRRSLILLAGNVPRISLSSLGKFTRRELIGMGIVLLRRMASIELGQLELLLLSPLLVAPVEVGYSVLPVSEYGVLLLGCSDYLFCAGDIALAIQEILELC